MRRIPVVGVSVPCVLRATALVLLCAAVPAQADWKRDYALGLRAIEQGDWAEAERHMRAAIAEGIALHLRCRSIPLAEHVRRRGLRDPAEPDHDPRDQRHLHRDGGW